MNIIRRVASGADGPPVSAFITYHGQVKLVHKPKFWQGNSLCAAVKDNIATDGSPTTCASAILQTHQSPFPAEVVTRLENGNPPVTVIGKTNMDEFGMGSHSMNSFFGPVRNSSPFPLHSVGGSSGGSAVAVAANSSVVGLGTDTGGSIRLPAAYTGVVGFKPSYGRISRWGVIPYANSLDTVGILAPTVDLLRPAFEQVNRFDPKDPTSLTEASRARMKVHREKELIKEWHRKLRSGEAKKDKAKLAFKNKKIGVPLEYNISELDPSIREAWQQALQLFQDNGATIVPISLPNTKHALSAYYVLAPAEAASNLSKYDGVRYGTRSGDGDGAGDVLYSNTRGSGFGDEVKRRILLGSYTLSSEAIDNYFIKAQKVRRLVQRDFDRVFVISNPLRPTEQFDLSSMDESIKLDDKLGPPQVDFIVCPTAPTLPPTQQMVLEQSPVDNYMNDVFTVPASLAGLPAISIPFPVPEQYRVKGQPDFAGIQIIGQYSDDDQVLWLANDLEKLTEVTAAVHKTQVPNPFNSGLTTQESAPTIKKRSSKHIPDEWVLQLKMEKWKSMERQRRAVNAILPEAIEAENKRIDQLFLDALVTWKSIQRRGPIGERTLKDSSAEKGNSDVEQSVSTPRAHLAQNSDADVERNIAFHETFRNWKTYVVPNLKSPTYERTKGSLDKFFDAWDLKREGGEKGTKAWIKALKVRIRRTKKGIREAKERIRAVNERIREAEEEEKEDEKEQQ
ncbi:amidase signature domain-containing protein [Leptodontidium sp. 2 PMI_412]|nr:amidase signature domain-containing protein [Leptodontidium sp. 2 PMI_412]